MRQILKEALEKERQYYTQRLCSLGVYSHDMTKNMTISDLKKEYHFFFNKKHRHL
ncbi:stress protein [Bacillus sp. Bos-x628]|uniref:stress protein n=1 Tax=Bacillus maqinnsis TaxID=3229854 RepID=UPI00338D75F5